MNCDQDPLRRRQPALRSRAIAFPIFWQHPPERRCEVELCKQISGLDIERGPMWGALFYYGTIGQFERGMMLERQR